MIYFLAHWDWILERSRSDIVDAIKNDYKIISICPLKENKKNIEKIYYKSIHWDLNRTKTFNLIGVFKLRKIIGMIEKGSILHIFTIKSLFLFLLSSIFLKKDFKIIASVTGLGYLFAGTKLGTFLKIILRPFIILKINNLIDILIFQNRENLDEFLSYSKFNGKVKIIEGSGLMTTDFKIKKNKNALKKIIFVGRLMREKGIYEYIEIADKMKVRTDMEFFIAGTPDFGNKSSINEEDFERIQNNPNLKYLGEIDVNSRLQEFDILIQPSYHEGLSRILIESIYVGLFCIANDIPGMKEIINKTQLGVLIKNNNIDSYINSIENLRKGVPDNQFYDARKIISTNYSVQAISNKFKKIYDEYN